MTERPFNIKEYIPYIEIKRNVSNDGYEQDLTKSGAPYTQLYDTATSAAWFLRSKIDVGGWTRDELTGFFASQFLQRTVSYNVVGLVDAVLGGMSGEDIVIVSDVPLDTDNSLWFHAGFPRADSDWMTIKFAEGIQKVQTSTSPVIMTTNDAWSFGSGEPTATDFLYVYRYITVRKNLPGPTDIMHFPTLRYVAVGIATDEPDHVYVNRLRRSFELQQS